MEEVEKREILIWRKAYFLREKNYILEKKKKGLWEKNHFFGENIYPWTFFLLVEEVEAEKEKGETMEVEEEVNRWIIIANNMK